MYFSLQKAKNLISKDHKKSTDVNLQKDYVKLLDFVRMIESGSEYSMDQLTKGGYYKGVGSSGASGKSPADIWLYVKLRDALDRAYSERHDRIVMG